MTEENYQYKWEKDFVNYFLTRKNNNREVVKRIITASKFFAYVETREGSKLWVHSVNGHLMEADHPDKMAQIQQAFKKADEDAT